MVAWTAILVLALKVLYPGEASALGKRRQLVSLSLDHIPVESLVPSSAQV